MRRGVRRSKSVPPRRDSIDSGGSTPSNLSSSTFEPSFVPFKLSGEQYANILRDPERFGYPSLDPGISKKPKYGHIYVELRAPGGRRPKLVDGFDWVPSSTANASSQSLADGKSKLMRYYCARRTKSDLAKPAVKPFTLFQRAVYATLREENPAEGANAVKSLVGERWRALSEAQKAPYTEEAEKSNEGAKARQALADPAELLVRHEMWLQPVGASTVDGMVHASRVLVHYLGDAAGDLLSIPPRPMRVVDLKEVGGAGADDEPDGADGEDGADGADDVTRARAHDPYTISGSVETKSLQLFIGVVSASETLLPLPQIQMHTARAVPDSVEDEKDLGVPPLYPELQASAAEAEANERRVRLTASERRRRQPMSSIPLYQVDNQNLGSDLFESLLLPHASQDKDAEQAAAASGRRLPPRYKWKRPTRTSARQSAPLSQLNAFEELVGDGASGAAPCAEPADHSDGAACTPIAKHSRASMSPGDPMSLSGARADSFEKELAEAGRGQDEGGEQVGAFGQLGEDTSGRLSISPLGDTNLTLGDWFSAFPSPEQAAWYADGRAGSPPAP